jgi:hypothetical protein
MVIWQHLPHAGFEIAQERVRRRVAEVAQTYAAAMAAAVAVNAATGIGHQLYQNALEAAMAELEAEAQSVADIVLPQDATTQVEAFLADLQAEQGKGAGSCCGYYWLHHA